MLKSIFFLLIPAIAIVFRIRKTITTGFLVGIIITSVFLGLMSVASVKRDPVNKFVELINQKKYLEAKSQLRIVIQFGPEKVKEIDVKKIAYIGLYNQMKNELKVYYYGLANKYNKKYKFIEISSCDDLKDHIKKMKYLNHALLLSGFAESIGGKDPIKAKLVKKIANGKKLRKSFKLKCKDLE